MNFNPLGNFETDSAAIPAIVVAARALYKKLPVVPEGDLTRAYLHWSVQGCSALDSAYNVVVGEAYGHYNMTVTHDPRDNARSTFKPLGYAAHSYHRNTGAVGIALNGMDGDNVSPNNFGVDPVTVMGLTWLCAAAGAVCARYGIDASGLSYDSDPFYGEPTILTHAECANLPGVPAAYTPYGIPPVGDFERWDLATFHPLPHGMVLTDEMAATCGDALRKLTRTYKVALS